MDVLITPFGYKKSTEQLALEAAALELYKLGWCPRYSDKMCNFNCLKGNECNDDCHDAISCIILHLLNASEHN